MNNQLDLFDDSNPPEKELYANPQALNALDAIKALNDKRVRIGTSAEVSASIGTYEIVFPIEPKAIQSVKFRVIVPKDPSKKPFASTYQPQCNIDFKEYISRTAELWVKEQINPFKPLQGAIGVNILYTYAFMKSHRKSQRQRVADGGVLWKTTNPDMMDNLQKGWIDALKGILWHDDGQICLCTGIVKKYDLEPSIRLRFWSLEEEQKTIIG